MDTERRVFQGIWTDKYLFVKHNNKPLCLICHSTLSVNKEYNLKRHYETKHQTHIALAGQLREDEIDKLKNNLQDPPSRKVDTECRIFQDSWTDKYLFVKQNNKPVCLICHSSISVNKEYNLKRHYETKHKIHNELIGQIRKDEIDKLKNKLETQSSIFNEDLSESDTTLHTSINSNNKRPRSDDHMQPFLNSETEGQHINYDMCEVSHTNIEMEVSIEGYLLVLKDQLRHIHPDNWMEYCQKSFGLVEDYKGNTTKHSKHDDQDTHQSEPIAQQL